MVYKAIKGVLFVGKAVSAGVVVALLAAILASLLPAMGLPLSGEVVLNTGIFCGVALVVYRVAGRFLSGVKLAQVPRALAGNSGQGARQPNYRNARGKPGGSVGQFALRIQNCSTWGVGDQDDFAKPVLPDPAYEINHHE